MEYIIGVLVVCFFSFLLYKVATSGKVRAESFQREHDKLTTLFNEQKAKLDAVASDLVKFTKK